MGVDASFDMVPRLSQENGDRHNWDCFIDFIKELYEDDDQVEIKPNYILFKAGEHPSLPFEGHKFLRFSSKISGSIATATNVSNYIDTVTKIARNHFGSRIHVWSEYADQLGYYSWDEVRETIRSYDQPNEPEAHTSIVRWLGHAGPLTEHGVTLLEVKDIPGKGRGLVARFDISEGTRILCEKPLLTVNAMPPDELEQTLAAKIKALSKVKQRQFLSLHNNFRGNKCQFGGIVRTNALPCGAGSSVGGVYPLSCLINHSCLPNSHNSWNSDEQHETIHAIRPIKSGEELTISYDRGGPSTVRQAFLLKAFGFHCNCDGCSLPPSELRASDERRLLIQRLDDEIGNPIRMMNSPKESLNDCRSLLQVLKKEYKGYVGAYNARFYYDAFQISIAHGDQARASVFAKRAYEARLICEGEDKPETRRVKSLALQPVAHMSFGLCSMAWKTSREKVPGDLKEAQFESWLFRDQT